MTRVDWSLRLARESDAAAYVTVEDDAAQVLHEEPSLVGIPVPPTRSAADYAAMIRQGYCLTALVDDNVVGFAATRPYRRELHLHELSVARKFQQQGIGTGLLRALLVDARNSGFRSVTLDTFRDIAWNAPFYAQLGFSIVEDMAAHPRLAENLAKAEEFGLPPERRCAMIAFLA